MRVFLIPIGADQYEPYFEPPDEVEDETAPEGTGWFARLRRSFRDTLREAEAARHRHHDPAPAERPRLASRVKARLLRWIVERAAEQRLLWHLRTAKAATLAVPDDLAAGAALAVLLKGLKRDGDRHRIWCVVHGLGLVLSLALVIVPGPNLVGYLLTFTTVGHGMAWRGARQGQSRTRWVVSPSAELSALRAVLDTDAPARDARVHEVAAQLGLRHLATFFERMTPRTA